MDAEDFPIIGTKVAGLTREFGFASAAERKEYFQAKVGDEIAQINQYLKTGTFIAYLLGKKNAGKGSYTKLFMEVFGSEHMAHLSVGDIMRETKKQLTENPNGDLYRELGKIYRGYMSLDEALDLVVNKWTQSTLFPTELVLALLKINVKLAGNKAIFIDGLPRDNDQVSYSLFFRDLINFRDDPDIFVLYETPNEIINQRIKYRVVCPICQDTRNFKTRAAKDVIYDEEKKFYMLCENPGCNNARMITKPGDEQGIEPIKARLEKEAELIKLASSLYGVKRMFVRNSIPVAEILQHYDKYEIAPEFTFNWDEKAQKVIVGTKEWVFPNDHGVPSCTVHAAATTVSMIRQLAEILQ